MYRRVVAAFNGVWYEDPNPRPEMTELLAPHATAYVGRRLHSVGFAGRSGAQPMPGYGLASRMPLTAAEISSASSTSAMTPTWSSQTSSSTRLRNSSSST